MKQKLPIVISVIVLIFAIFIKAMDFSVIKNIQLRVFDSFQVNYPREYSPQPVAIIDIDDASLARIGQWPWPRNILAQMVGRLKESGAAVIGFDIVFAEEDRTSPKNILPLWGVGGIKNQGSQNQELRGLKAKENESLVLDSSILKLFLLPDHDEIFSKEMENSNSITGFVLTQDKTETMPNVKAGFSYVGVDPKPYLQNFAGGVASLPILEKSASGNGVLNSSPDSDGILRRTPLILTAEGKFYPSLVMEALRVAQGASGYVIKSTGASDEQDSGEQAVTSVKVGQLTIPTDKNGKFLIYYSGHRDERFVPAWKILEPGFDVKQLEGYIVLFGTSAAGLKDIRATPFSPTTAGIEVHAEAIEQILSGQFLYRPDWLPGAEITIMFVVGIILIIMMAYLSAIWGALFTFLILSAAILFSREMFVAHQILIDPVTPGMAIILVFISESLLRYITAEREKKEVRNAFSHYMSPALVEQLAQNPKSLKLGGETKNLTMLFCDIRGFTTISEGLSAEELTSFINKFLTPMTNIILNHKGTIDKYMGDCIMAFWNAPLDDSEHPVNAAISALEMISSLKEFNIQQEKNAIENGRKFIPINIGIGLNTGDACVGNMGSDQRFDYSVLGDDVNLASRLEGQSKNYGVSIVIGEKTKDRIKGFAVLELDLIKVKGKNKPVTIYTLLGGAELASSEKFLKLKEVYGNMLESYRVKQWDKAINLMNECKALLVSGNENNLSINLDGLFELYEERIADFKQTPPPENWDGVYTATSK